MNTQVAVDPVILDEQEGRVVIRWTEEEREMLKLWFVEYFSKSLPSMENWIVTRRNLMMAQLEILAEDRFRHYLIPTDVVDMQTRLEAHIQSAVYEKLVDEHKAYMAKHGISPIAHVSKIQAALHEAEGKICDLAIQLDSKTTSLEAAHSSISRLEGELALLRKQQQQQPQAATPTANLKLALCGPHFTSEQKATLEAYGNVIWVESNHSAKDAQRLASGRIVLIVKGDCGTSMTKALRAAASQQITVNGFSSMLNAVQDLAKQ